MRAYEYKKRVLAVLKHKHTNVFLSGTHQILLHKLVPGIDANPPWLMMILMQCLFLDWNLQLSSLGHGKLHFYVLHLHLLPFMLLTAAHLWNIMKKNLFWCLIPEDTQKFSQSSNPGVLQNVIFCFCLFIYLWKKVIQVKYFFFFYISCFHSQMRIYLMSFPWLTNSFDIEARGIFFLSFRFSI